MPISSPHHYAVCVGQLVHCGELRCVVGLHGLLSGSGHADTLLLL